MANLTFFTPDFTIEESYKNQTVVGIDEAGRGPLAGPVVAATAYLDQKFLESEICKKINDSKKLSKNLRKKIYLYLIENIQFGVGVVDENIIDKINILNATKFAMKKSHDDFCQKNKAFAQIILVDGNFIPFEKSGEIKEILPIVKGDQKSLSIACASIIAKEYRDEIMTNLHQEFPHFLWNKNAAYPTKEHVEKIKEFGICKYHRKSFEPIKSMLKS
jgi:ribonuclease HII